MNDLLEGAVNDHQAMGPAALRMKWVPVTLPTAAVAWKCAGRPPRKIQKATAA